MQESQYRAWLIVSVRLHSTLSFACSCLLMKSKVYIETFGCQMNVADTERAATGLRRAGYCLTERIDDADVVLFNTCSVRARAEQKVFNRIGSVRLGEKKPVLGIMGCVAQLEGDSLFESAPGVSLVIGTRATDRLASLIERINAGERKVIDLGGRQI